MTRKMYLLKKELEEVDKQFIGKCMQDANEFLCRLMDSMKENIVQLFQELSPGLKAGEPIVIEKEHSINLKVHVPNLVNSNFLSEVNVSLQSFYVMMNLTFCIISSVRKHSSV